MLPSAPKGPVGTPSDSKAARVRSTPFVGIGAAACLLLSVAGCGGSDAKSEADIKNELSETLQGDGGEA